MAKKRDFRKEAEDMIAEVSSLLNQYRNLLIGVFKRDQRERGLGPVGVSTPIIFTKKEKKKARKIISALQKIDPYGLIKMASTIPFEETLIVLDVPKRYREKVSKRLRSVRSTNVLLLTELFLRNKLVKPLRK